MICSKCDGDVYRIRGLCTDRDGIREDAYCPDCNIRWGVRAHGLELISEAADQCELMVEITELRTTLRTILKIT